MLEKEQLYAISICKSSGIHPDQAVEIVEADTVISEKLIATRWSVA